MSTLRKASQYLAVAAISMSSVANSWAQPDLTREVWFEYGLASLLTGRLQSGQPAGLAIYVVAIGPRGDGGREEQRMRALNRAVVPGLVQALTDMLDRRVASVAERLEKVPPAQREDARKAARAKLASEVGEAVAAVQTHYNAKVAFRNSSGEARDLAIKSLTSPYELALVMRSCDGTPETCTVASFAGSRPNRSTDRFAKVYEWLRPAVGGKVNSFAIFDANSRGPLARPVFETPTSRHWTPAPEPATQIARLEVAVAHARRSGVRLNVAVPELVGVGQTSAVRFIDVLSDPATALRSVKRDGGNSLGKISDELARARVTDCAKLRGNSAPADVMKCAGYQGDATTVTNCLAGKRCFPLFGDRTVADVMLISKPGSLKELIQQSANSRMHLGPIADVERTARECAKNFGKDKSAGLSCLVIARSSAADRAAVECAQRNASHPTPESLVACVPPNALSAATRAQLACTIAAAKSSKPETGLALCAAMPLLPPAAQAIARCAEKFAGNVESPKATRAGLSCLALASGSREMRAAAGCIEKHASNWQSAAMCTAAATGGLPPEAKKVIGCAQAGANGGNVATNVGLCLVADKLPGDVGKAAQCYVSGGGNPAATAVCLASDGLTLDQRIALQCAAQSGGVPATWAVCTGGQLAYKEFLNCRGGERAFGDKCFGKGNDLRRFAENVTGSEIGPNSVVADIVTVQIKIAEFYVGSAEAIVKGGEHLVGEIGKGLGGFQERGGKVARDPGKAFVDCVNNLFGCVK